MQTVGLKRRRVLSVIALFPLTAWSDSAFAQPAASRALPARVLPTVVIDPGHGGMDPGAIGAHGVYEKDIVLATASEVARQLVATGRFRVMLTRRGDEFLPLRERVARAHAWKADLFVSIHADALPDADLRGLSVFTQSATASDREAASVAKSENHADLIAGINLSQQPREVWNILLDLTRRETGNLSAALAHKITTELGREIVLRGNAQRSADFAVLTASDVPSVLVELGCLSNSAEERLLQQRAYQQKLARGLVRAIAAYFEAYGGR